MTLFSDVSINGYNANPPSDDGAQTSTNKITWAGIKTKLTDPIIAALTSLNTNLDEAFAAVPFGGADAALNTDYTLQGTDNGKVFECTAALTLTMPDATTNGTPFVVAVVNDSSGNLTLAPHASQHINGGGANIVLRPGGSGQLMCTGAQFLFSGSGIVGGYYEFDQGSKVLLFNSNAPLGWTKDTTINDAAIQLVSGTVGADSGTVAYSSVFAQQTIAKGNLPNYNLNVADPGHSHVIPTSNAGGASGAGNAVTIPGSGVSNSAVTGISVALGGSGIALDFRVKTAQAIRIAKN